MLDRLGSGGMGVVWRARDERLQRVVAVKQLWALPGLTDAQAEAARRRALREARIAARLQHPGAIVVFDVAEHDGYPVLVMEHLPSRSLAAVVEDRGVLPPAEVAAIGRQVAAALAAAHAAGIVHRDVKPGNVLLTEDGVAKITDFGVSRAVGDATATRTGITAGTPAYLAPEVARGQEPTAASDVFSLGATLYTAVEGRPPFGTPENPLALLHAVSTGVIDPPRRAGALTPVLTDLLQPDPAGRPSMAEAAARLAAVAAAPRPPAAPRAAAGPAPARPAARWAAAVGVAAGRADARTELPATVATGPAVTARLAAPTRSDAPAAPRPDPPRTRGRRSRVPVVAAAVALLAAAGVGAATLLDREPAPPPVAAAPATPSTEPTAPSSTTSSAAPQTQLASSGSIAFQPAGQLVIDFYNDIEDSDAAWAVLSPGARAVFGSRAEFDEYWASRSVSAENARGVTTNEDGSVTVPADVTVDGDTGQRRLRVVQVDGELLIDSDPR